MFKDRFSRGLSMDVAQTGVDGVMDSRGLVQGIIPESIDHPTSRFILSSSIFQADVDWATGDPV